MSQLLVDFTPKDISDRVIRLYGEQEGLLEALKKSEEDSHAGYWRFANLPGLLRGLRDYKNGTLCVYIRTGTLVSDRAFLCELGIYTEQRENTFLVVMFVTHELNRFEIRESQMHKKRENKWVIAYRKYFGECVYIYKNVDKYRRLLQKYLTPENNLIPELTEVFLKSERNLISKVQGLLQEGTIGYEMLDVMIQQTDLLQHRLNF